MKNKEVKIKEIIKTDKKIVKKHISYIVLSLWIYFIIFIIISIIGFNSTSGILYNLCYSNIGTVSHGYILISYFMLILIFLGIINKKIILKYFLLIITIFLFLGIYQIDKYNKMTHLVTIKNSSIALNGEQPILLDNPQEDTNCYYLVTYNNYGDKNLIDLEYCNPGKSKEILEKVKKLRDKKIKKLGLSN